MKLTIKIEHGVLMIVSNRTENADKFPPQSRWTLPEGVEEGGFVGECMTKVWRYEQAMQKKRDA